MGVAPPLCLVPGGEGCVHGMDQPVGIGNMYTVRILSGTIRNCN